MALGGEEPPDEASRRSLFQDLPAGPGRRLLRAALRRLRGFGPGRPLGSLAEGRAGALRLVQPQRFLPYCSWLETQSSDEIAAAREISPASTTPAMISASLPT